MNDFSTIRLIHGELTLTNAEFKEFEKGDAVWGCDTDPDIVKTWDISQKDEAKAELAKHRCKYSRSDQLHFIDEWALDYCLCDEEGEFLSGSDFDLAEEIPADE